MFKHKKGDIISLIISLIVIFFVVAVIAVVFAKPLLTALGTFKTAEGMPDTAVQATELVETHAIPWLDYLVLFSFISIAIGLIVSSLYIDIHPALAILFILMLIVAVILAGIFGNTMQTIGSDPTIAPTYAQFTLSSVIFAHLPLMVFIIGLIVLIILYGKSRSGGSVV